MTARKLFGELFALICSVMLGLAAGAVWLVPIVFLRRPLPMLALPIGWLLALAIRHWVYRRQLGRTVLAVIATAVAAIYMSMLVAALNIAASMGDGLIETIRTAGPAMLFELAHLGVRSSDIAWFAAGIALAALTAWQMPRRVNAAA